MSHEPHELHELHRLATELTAVLEEQSRGFDSLREAMAGARAAFTSVGARGLWTGIGDLEEQSRKLAEAESRRNHVTDRLGGVLGLCTTVRISRIQQELPGHLGRALRHAADRAGGAAQRLRVECRAGTRLLQLSEEANAGILESLLGVSRGGSAACYDGNARARSNDSPGGSLVSGTA